MFANKDYVNEPQNRELRINIMNFFQIILEIQREMLKNKAKK